MKWQTLDEIWKGEKIEVEYDNGGLDIIRRTIVAKTPSGDFVGWNSRGSGDTWSGLTNRWRLFKRTKMVPHYHGIFKDNGGTYYRTTGLYDGKEAIISPGNFICLDEDNPVMIPIEE